MQKRTIFFAALILIANLSSNAYAQSTHQSGIGGFFHRMSSWFQKQSSNSGSNVSNSLAADTSSPAVESIDISSSFTPTLSQTVAAAPVVPTPLPSNRAPVFNALTDTAGNATDGAIEIKGTFNPNAQIKITLTNSTSYGIDYTFSENIMAAPDGSIDVNGHMLNQGPGLYLVDIFVADADGNFNEVNEIKITNTSAIYTSPSQLVESSDPQIVNLANSITGDLTDEMSKTQAIHDWVSTHITYAFEADGTTPDMSAALDAIGVLNAGKGICQGYSDLFAAIARASGLTARVVVGTTVNHAWNEVLIDNQWIRLDTTWDAAPAGSPALETYFNFSATNTSHPPRAFAADE